MTLTDFLLARIAEDEAVAQGVVNTPDRHWSCDPSRLHDTGQTDLIAHGSNVAAGTARVLADCEAKRSIIERACAAAAISGADLYADVRAVRLAFDLVLGDMAEVYAEHPDYEQEWAV